MMRFTIHQVKESRDLERIRELFLEYTESLDLDLSAQDFDQELSDLPGKYAPPSGCILLATSEYESAGCIAMRPLTDSICEMKRLYVRPQYRKSGLGRLLIQQLIKESKALGYGAMRLDTLPSKVKQAMGLYQDLGFKPIPAYWSNPIPGIQYMELNLRK